MNISDDLKAAHLDLSTTDWELRQFALDNPEYRKQENFPLFNDLPEVFLHRVQLWPTFISRAKLDELKALSLGVSELVRGILDRVFDGDPVAVSRYYDIANPATAKVLMSQPNGIAEAIARGDFVMTRHGFKCLELNVGANLGGWETGLIAEMHIKTSLTSRFMAERGLEVSYTDTLGTMFKHIFEDSRTLFPDKDKPLNIAFGFQAGEQPPELVDAMVEVLEPSFRQAREETGSSPESRLLTCFPEQLTLESDGSLKLGEDRVHAIVAIYGAGSQTVLRSFKTGQVKLYNSPICPLLSDKRVIAMLSMLAETDLVDAEERQLIEKVIPWTRTIDVPPALKKVYEAVSADELIARREELVLKKANSHGGEDVYLGPFTVEEDWPAIVEQAVASPRWVMQEYVQSIPYLYQNGEGECSPHNVIWGPFLFGKTYGGMILRMQPQADAGPVNLTLTATEGMLFEVD